MPTPARYRLIGCDQMTSHRRWASMRELGERRITMGSTYFEEKLIDKFELGDNITGNNFETLWYVSLMNEYRWSLLFERQHYVISRYTISYRRQYQKFISSSSTCHDDHHATWSRIPQLAVAQYRDRVTALPPHSNINGLFFLDTFRLHIHLTQAAPDEI